MNEFFVYKTVGGLREGDEWRLICDCGWTTTTPDGTEDDTAIAHTDDSHSDGHDMNQTWRCPDCHDTMPAKYKRTHPPLCAIASALIAQRIDREIGELNEGN